MKVLLTGAGGNVGFSTLKALTKKEYFIRIFDIKNKRNKKLFSRYKNKVEILYGDIRNIKDVQKAVEDIDVVIHVAAIIPPLADKNVPLSHAVNVEGSRNLVKAMESSQKNPGLIYTSSIAVYGDRRENPLIKPTDALNPNDDDEYAKQKIKAEKIIMASKLKWAIFRLTFIVSDKLKMDPIMFYMPLDTPIEPCHTEDVGIALANAVENEEIWGKTMHIAGGKRFRLTYKEFLSKMMEIFGLGKDFLPKEAFSKNNFHCGFMTTEDSESLLHYQRHSKEDYFNEIKQKIGIKKYVMRIFRPFIRHYMLKRSPFYNK